MFGCEECSSSRLTLREKAVVQALLANETVEEIAARFRTSAATIKAHAAAIYRKVRLRTMDSLMREYFASEAEWLEQNRIEALRRMLASTGTRDLHLHQLAALRAWTGAGQAFLWEIRDGRDGLRLVGESGINYAVRSDGVVPALAARPVAIAGADAIQREEWAIVASAEAGALPIQGEAVVLTMAYDGCRWLALLANLPDGHAYPAAAELAQALVEMARTVATSWTVQLKKMAASAVAGTHGDVERYASPSFGGLDGLLVYLVPSYTAKPSHLFSFRDMNRLTCELRTGSNTLWEAQQVNT